MNILYHHRTQGTGAEGVHIAYTIKGFRELGHQVRVVCPNRLDPAATAGASPYSVKTGAVARGLHALSRVLPQFLFELLEFLYNGVAYLRLSGTLRAMPVDLLYERYAFFLWVGAWVAKRRRCFYVVEVNEIAGEARVRGQSFPRLAQRLERYTFDRADAIIVVSAFLKQRIEALGVDGQKVHVIPNGVDERLFDPSARSGAVRERLHIGSRDVVVGFVGWFVGWHNLERLVEVFGRVARGMEAKLLLVGDGLLKERLATIARDAGVVDQVLFPGAIPYADIPEYVNAMDVCVIPGSNDYRSPIKLFEYMAMEKAVVAPRLGPIVSVVNDGVHAVLFDQNDAASLEGVLAELLGDRERRVSLGRNARRLVLAQHTWTLNARRIIDIVERAHDG